MRNTPGLRKSTHRKILGEEDALSGWVGRWKPAGTMMGMDQGNALD